MNIIEVKNLSKEYKYKVKDDKKGFFYNLFNEKEKVVMKYKKPLKRLLVLF